MQLIQCPFCGEELLLVPDPKAMDKANDRHAALKPKPKGHVGVSEADIVNTLARLEIEAITLNV